MQPAIYIENLSKKYQLGLTHARSLNEVAARWSTRFRRMCRTRPSSEVTNEDIASHKTFWALKDINLEIKPGTVVGVIGRNGAGKSTLLKILSRVTKPSTGRVDLRGRVASLLEVGTGFHPELTGRENVYMNGTLLGMTKREVDRRFTEIVEFAGVEQFIDTPVKRYSSGMKVRLGFAVAAHLEPEILIVDEVLAVGDAAFQRKCIGRMSAVAAGGRTVVFVSHNMNAVESLCNEALYIHNGLPVERGTDVRGIITRYLSGNNGNNSAASAWKNCEGGLDHPTVQPLYFAVENDNGKPVADPMRNDQQVFVVIHALIRQLDPALNLGFSLYNQDSEQLLWSLTTDGPEDEWPRIHLGMNEFRCAIPKRLLNEGTYRLELICSSHCREWIVRPGHNSPSIHFEIRGGLSDSPYWLFARPGTIAPEWRWEHRFHNKN